jgi:hypothetical protein
LIAICRAGEARQAVASAALRATADPIPAIAIDAAFAAF